MAVAVCPRDRVLAQKYIDRLCFSLTISVLASPSSSPLLFSSSSLQGQQDILIIKKNGWMDKEQHTLLTRLAAFLDERYRSLT